MKKILITKGKSSGRMAHLVYSYYRHDVGFCQMESTSQEGYKRVFWAVPIFDHCGEPKIEELLDGDFVVMDK